MRNCLQCGKFTSNAKFCGRSCAGTFNNTGRRQHGKDPGNCLQCGERLTDSATNHCSFVCYHRYRHEQYIKKWKKKLETGCYANERFEVTSYVRRHLHEVSNNRCSKCGWSKIHPATGKVPLQINHIDGNYRNCCEKNVELICPNCHALTDNWGGRNKGNGRPRK